jgi:hypothetical protein
MTKQVTKKMADEHLPIVHCKYYSVNMTLTDIFLRSL